ncbi:hypothetical protein ACHAXR_008520, partial [Thalassiosira sp. AJA248-18]
STISSSPDKSINDVDHQGENNVGVELWLDLRGTSLTPKTALELWDMEEQQNIQQDQLESQKVDSLSKPPFVKFLISSNQKSQDNRTRKNGENERNIEVLLVAEEDDGEDNMKSILQQPNSSSIGKILSLETSSSSMPILPDPLPAMDVVTKGQWVILDTNGWKKISEEERIQMVLPLVELLSPGASGSAGGIGLTCHTNSEVMKAAMYFQSMANGGGSSGRGNMKTKTLESGIVVPDDDDADKSSTSDDGIRNGNNSNNLAMIVPYEMELLRTAKLLLFGDNYSAESHDNDISVEQ